jgi:hypothetical protein
VRFDTYHRNDQPNALRNSDRPLPIVAAETDAGFVILLGSRELDDCGGSLESLAEAIACALARAKLTWPT